MPCLHGTHIGPAVLAHSGQPAVPSSPRTWGSVAHAHTGCFQGTCAEEEDLCMSCLETELKHSVHMMDCAALPQQTLIVSACPTQVGACTGTHCFMLPSPGPVSAEGERWGPPSTRPSPTQLPKVHTVHTQPYISPTQPPHIPHTPYISPNQPQSPTQSTQPHSVPHTPHSCTQSGHQAKGTFWAAESQKSQDFREPALLERPPSRDLRHIFL